MECRFEQKLVRFLDGIRKIYSVERKSLPREKCGPGRLTKKSKRLPDQTMYGQKYGPTFVKPLRIDKNKNGKTMLED